jgi:hypothetical protein
MYYTLSYQKYQQKTKHISLQLGGQRLTFYAYITRDWASGIANCASKKHPEGCFLSVIAH